MKRITHSLMNTQGNSYLSVKNVCIELLTFVVIKLDRNFCQEGGSRHVMTDARDTDRVAPYRLMAR